MCAGALREWETEHLLQLGKARAPLGAGVSGQMIRERLVLAHVDVSLTAQTRGARCRRHHLNLHGAIALYLR